MMSTCHEPLLQEMKQNGTTSNSLFFFSQAQFLQELLGCANFQRPEKVSNKNNSDDIDQ